MNKTFVGFGFGAIQGGLFLYEAFRSGQFKRLVVAEVVPETVQAVRAARGRYRVNIAGAGGIAAHEVAGVEIFNPHEAEDRLALIEAVARADELATALPSVKFYGGGETGSVIDLLAEGLRRRFHRKEERRSIVYAAENHNHAAELLAEALHTALGADGARCARQVQCLNTVIGKMSGIVTDEAQIAAQHLARMTGATGRCLLVESFNRILISRVRWADFPHGIPAFEEKDDLLPFEEAKLYGHNATHALLGYLARERGYAYMADAREDAELLKLTREAFIEESGRALCRRHRGRDVLFTEAGYQAYADDLLTRMLNPHLRDAVERVVRDPRRKLGWDDRLIGTMRVALEAGIRPWRFARGARAAARMLAEEERRDARALLAEIWADANAPEERQQHVLDLVFKDGEQTVSPD